MKGWADAADPRSDRYWPTDRRRPDESIAAWCRRLDGYVNGPEGATEEQEVA